VPLSVIGEVLPVPAFEITGIGANDLPAFDLMGAARAWKEGLERWLA
jgi:hypothetical protein